MAPRRDRRTHAIKRRAAKQGLRRRDDVRFQRAVRRLHDRVVPSQLPPPGHQRLSHVLEGTSVVRFVAGDLERAEFCGMSVGVGVRGLGGALRGEGRFGIFF